MNIIFQLEIQDGEAKRKEFKTATLPDTATKEEINARGEEILRESWTGDEDGEWVWNVYGEKCARYYTYHVIPDDKSFEIIKNIM